MAARLLLASTVASLVLGSLACGGAWDDAAHQAISEQCDKLTAKVMATEEGDNRARALEVLGRCKADADSGRLGLVGVSRFGATIERAVHDGRIDDAERLGIESDYGQALRASRNL